MTLLGKGFRRILSIAVIAVIIILIVLNVVLNIKLRADIPNLIAQFSKETPYDISVGKINIDPLFRLQLDQVVVNDPLQEKKEVLNVEQVTVNPNIIASLFNQRIHIGEIAFKNPQVQSNQENINKLRDFIESRSTEDKSGLVQLGIIKVLYGDFHVSPEFMVSIPRLDIELVNSQLAQDQEIKFAGEIDLLERKVDLNGKLLLTPDKTSGELNIKSSNINVAADSREALKANSKMSFVIQDLVEVNGVLSVDTDKGIFSEDSLAHLKYDLEYDKSKDSAEVKSLDFQVRDLISGTFSGKIDKVTKETIFKLSGNTNSLNIKDLMVQIFKDDKGFISGELNTNELNIVGSRASNDIRLTGNAKIAGLDFNSDKEDDPSINGLKCDLQFNQSLSESNNFSLNSVGKCSADNFLWDKTGEVGNLVAQVKLDSKDKWIDNKIALSNITSSYMDGVATGKLNFLLSDGFGGGITTISGDIQATNLNLEKTPKTIIPANIAGTAQTASAQFEGGSNNYNADILITANNFLLKSKKGREFRVSRLQTSQPVDFKYKSPADTEEKTGSNHDEILINGAGVSYQGLSFEEYNISSGRVKEFEFLLELGADRWALDMSSQGSGFTIAGHDVSLDSFDESLSIKNSGREGFSGTINGSGGRYKSIDFPSLSWNYNFINDRIIVSDVSTQISTIGNFKTDTLYINVGPEVSGYPYRVNFDEATFTGLQGKLSSQGIKGNFVINKPGTTDLDWHGNVDITKTKIVSAVIDNISNNIIPTEGGIKLKDIEGTYLGGDITGNVDIDTTKSPSGIDVALTLLGASVNSGSLNLKLNNSDLKFLGTIPNGALPEGQSTLELKDVVMESEGISSRLISTVNARTTAETLYIDKGFIRSNNGKEIDFTGEMTDSLNENRTLSLSFPEVAISDALGLLSPVVPKDFREFKTSGYAHMDLEFRNLFYPGSHWTGKLSLRDSSFSGEYGGGMLVVENVDGTITIKDKVSSENPLTNFMGENLKLSKSIFQKFLKSFEETKLDEDLDFLAIDKVEYGVLKFENIEVALEIDQEKINIRKLLSKMFRGSFYGAGLIMFNQDHSKYNFSLLFNEISLESISERVSPGQQYITGRLNGLAWLTADGTDLNTVDGPFKFWSKRSSKEHRRIGGALLAKMGARERFILGSSRSYDNGNISGYINDGLITFREFEISNSILGIRNLTIQADAVRNSISISQLVSTVRELSRRSESGMPMIETN